MSLKSSLILVVALLSGCSLLTPSGPTNVARGEYYAAGRPEFDAFFIDLYQLQVELLEAPAEPRQARRNLAQSLALAAEASDESLSSRLAQELKKLASGGLRLRLDVPEPTASLDASATLHTSEAVTACALCTSLSQEATRLVRSRNRMLATKAELEKLRVTGIKLEGNVDRAFRVEGPWKRDEVRENLSDGQKLITLMQSHAQEVEDQDTKLLALVSSVATTDANLGKPPVASEPDAEAIAPAAKARRAPSRAAVRPRTTSKPSTQPAAKAAPPKPRDDDASPAIKPTQGSAPAEIEP